MLSKLPLIEHLLAVFKRRRWYFVVPFIVLLIASVAVVFALPTTYLSTGKIGVESQQIPEDFVRSTITTHSGERVGMMQARVMTSSRLEDIVERMELYSEDWGTVPQATLAERLKYYTTIQVISDPYASRLGAIAFTVGFEHAEPQTAQAVAAELIKLFLEENVITRTARATETTEFLGRQAERLGEQARVVDQQIAEFKRQNRNALPEHLDLKTSMVTRAESELRAVMIEISSLQQELRYLDTQSSGSATVATVNDVRVTAASPVEQLQALKTELAEKSLRYSSEHWDIKGLKADIASLEEQIFQRELSEDAGASGAASPPRTKIDAQSYAITTRLNLLRDREKSLRGDIERLQAEILEIPLVEIELRRLTDQYSVLMEEYGEIRGKRHDAELAQSLEQEQKAERFILLEPAEIPLSPMRSFLKLLMTAFVLSLAGGVGVAYAAELLDDRIYGRSMLGSLTGEQPLAVIPYLSGVPSIESS